MLRPISTLRALSAPLLCLLLWFGLASPAAAVRVDLLVPPWRALTLYAAVPVGASNITALRVAGTAEDFVVPTGQILLLTDLIIAPQVIPISGAYAIQVLPTLPFSTVLNLYASADEPSSLQLQLNSAMRFEAGSTVRVAVNFGPAPVTVSAFGYLVKAN
jgi:hypothetical protein